MGGSREKNNGKSGNGGGTVIKSRLTSASTKLSFCFTAHCIGAVDSPNNTIQLQHKPDEDGSTSQQGSISRSPYECPICFEQYQFDFDTTPSKVRDEADTASQMDQDDSDETEKGGQLTDAITNFRDHLPRLMQCGHTLCSKCLG